MSLREYLDSHIPRTADEALDLARMRKALKDLEDEDESDPLAEVLADENLDPALREAFERGTLEQECEDDEDVAFNAIEIDTTFYTDE